ncbi:MAG: GAF domain-containing protein, partial [Caldimonas sp.]
MSIDLRRLVETGRRLSEARAEAELHEVLIEAVVEHLGVQRALLVLADDGRYRIAGAHLPAGERSEALLLAVAPWFDEARRTRRARLRHGPDGVDMRAQRSCLVAPIVARKAALGCLYGDLDGALGRFAGADRDRLAMLAGQGAVALANLRATRHLEVEVGERTAALNERVSELEVIGAIQRGVAVKLEFQDIVDMVGDKLREVFRTGNVSMVWWDEATDMLQTLYNYEHGAPIPHRPPRKLASEGPGARMREFLRARRPVVLNTRAEQSAVGMQPVAGTDWCHSLTSVPIIGSDRVLGFLGLQNHEREFAYGPAEVRLLQTIAASMGVALENARLVQETKEALERQTATAEILRVISRSPDDVQPVFNAIAVSAFKLLGDCFTGVLRRAGDRYELVALYRGERPIELPPGAAIAPIDPAANFPSRVFLSGELLHIPDWSAIELPVHEQGVHAGLGIESSLMLPLMRGDECIAVLFIGREAAGTFTDKEIALARSFVDQASIAIENVRLFNETQEALERQTASAEVLRVISRSVADTAPVFEAIVTSCQRLFAGDNAIISLLREDGRIYHEAAAASAGYGGEFGGAQAILETLNRDFPRPLAQSYQAYPIRKRRVVHYPDIVNGPGVPEGMREMGRSVGNFSMLIAPLLWEDQGVGTIHITRFPPRPFTDKEAGVLATFADQAVIAIQNARLFRETKEALEQQKASAEILSVISSSVADTQPVFEKILQSCKHLFGGDELDVLLVDEQGQLRIGAYLGAARDIVAATFPAPVERTPAGQAIRERRVMHWPDLVDGADVPGVLRKMAKLIGYRSMMFAPMLWKNRGIGAIGVARSTGPFKPKELALAQTFADQAVIAIQNAQLFRETQEALERQTATAEVLQVIGSSVADTAPVFDKILHSVQKLFASFRVSITLVDDDDGLLHMNADLGGSPEFNESVKSFYPRPLAGSLQALALEQRRPVHLPDVANDPSLPAALHQLAQQVGNYSVVIAPMLWEGRGVGAIVVSRVP